MMQQKPFSLRIPKHMGLELIKKNTDYIAYNKIICKIDFVSIVANQHNY